MLNRRFLRIKVFEALYAYYQGSGDLVYIERQLLKSIDRIFELYLYMLTVPLELLHHAQLELEQRKEKRLPTKEDLNPNKRFVENEAIALLANNDALRNLIEGKKISWQNEFDLTKRLYREIRDTEAYEYYLNAAPNNFKEDQKFLIDIFKKHIADHEPIHDLLEEKDIHWHSDITVANSNVIKTYESLNKVAKAGTSITRKLHKDKKEDLDFARKLLRKTINNDADYEKLISEKASNWEVERIVMVDVILMKMGICELLNFPTVPVKVTLNEYIDLSKGFSTPKSKMFINGVLDKLVIALKAEGTLIKTGRGLVG